MPPLLRDPAFLAFLAADVLKRFTSAALTASLSFQADGLTHDPLDFGWLGLAEAALGVTLVLCAGHGAGCHPRRRIVLAATACLGVLAAGTGRVWRPPCMIGGGAGGLVTVGIVALTAWCAPRLRRLNLVAVAGAAR